MKPLIGLLIALAISFLLAGCSNTSPTGTNAIATALITSPSVDVSITSAAPSTPSEVSAITPSPIPAPVPKPEPAAEAITSPPSPPFSAVKPPPPDAKPPLPLSKPPLPTPKPPLPQAPSTQLPSTATDVNQTTGSVATVAFMSYGKDSWDEYIYLVETDGTGLRKLTPDKDVRENYPQFSPDGQKIVFSRLPKEGKPNIWMMNTDGTGRVALTNINWADMPAWSPDGKQIAFVSQNDNQVEISVMASDGTNIKRLTKDASFDVLPVWSPDGNRIAYLSDRGGIFRWWVINSDGTDDRLLADIKVYEKEVSAPLILLRAIWGRDIFINGEYFITPIITKNEVIVANIDLLKGIRGSLTFKGIQNMIEVKGTIPKDATKLVGTYLSKQSGSYDIECLFSEKKIVGGPENDFACSAMMLKSLMGSAGSSVSIPATTPSLQTGLPTPASIPTPTPVSTPVPSTSKIDWTLIERVDENYSIKLPKTWNNVDLSAKDNPMKQFGYILFALDQVPHPTTYVSPGSVSVIKIKPTMPTEVALDVIRLSEVKSLENNSAIIKPISSQIVQLAVGDAIQFRYQRKMSRSTGQTETVVFLQYDFLKNGNFYVMTFETYPDQADKYIPIYDEIAKSFKFLE